MLRCQSPEPRLHAVTAAASEEGPGASSSDQPAGSTDRQPRSSQRLRPCKSPREINEPACSAQTAANLQQTAYRRVSRAGKRERERHLSEPSRGWLVLPEGCSSPPPTFSACSDRQSSKSVRPGAGFTAQVKKLPGTGAQGLLGPFLMHVTRSPPRRGQPTAARE